jgi:glucosamine--fructose-6-phosphate aminotransferase (isomerizing)
LDKNKKMQFAIDRSTSTIRACIHFYRDKKYATDNDSHLLAISQQNIFIQENFVHSMMLGEALSAADFVQMQLESDVDRVAELGRHLRSINPAHIVTIARGSSDHAASYLSYLAMARTGRFVTSLPLSLVTLEKAQLMCDDVLALAISQSGQSPDVLESMRYFSRSKATTVSLVNDTDSPLASTSDWTFSLHAGTERSVAATKSFIASLVAGVRLIAAWQNDQHLLSALKDLPVALRSACDIEWQQALDVLTPARNLMVIGRGIGFPIACEAALKFKETSAIQAEAFSGAEIKHGPMALVESGYPLLIFAMRGPAQASLIALAAEMRERGARVLLAAPTDVASRDLDLPLAPHPDLDPIVAIQAFYKFAARLAQARGMNPDQPRHLNKVTKTI